MSFRPEIGLEGFRLISSFDAEKFTCKEFENEVHQLAFLLYPSERFNENFLRRIRDCMLKLSNDHPVKKWLTHLSTPVKPNARDQAKIDFILEMLNSKFNLITDQKIKASVISFIADAPEGTSLEKLLKSYMFLMLGNMTRSDKLLRSIIETTPRDNYRGYGLEHSLYHSVTANNLDKIFQKFSRHPANRRTFELLNLYVLSFFNREDLITLVKDVQTDELEGKLNLAYTERIAPELVKYARLTHMSEKRLIKSIRSAKYPLEMQAYWVWAYLFTDPMVSEPVVDEIMKIEKTDPLWPLFILDSEKAADLYFKKGGQSVSKRRKFLRKHLDNKEDFMMILFKLIEVGDIDKDLVEKTAAFLTHE